MQISDSILQDVRRLVAEILALDLSEVRPDDLFFEDLGANRSKSSNFLFTSISCTESGCDSRICSRTNSEWTIVAV